MGATQELKSGEDIILYSISLSKEHSKVVPYKNKEALATKKMINIFEVEKQRID